MAVKMVKPHADITYIKALMAELKIMSHIGKHLNIVNLLGACTMTLNKRELLVIVEYCRFGNIQKYLMVHRNHYIDQVDPFTGEINFMIGEDILDGMDDEGRDMARVREAIQCCRQILINGMKSLKHITVDIGYCDYHLVTNIRYCDLPALQIWFSDIIQAAQPPDGTLTL